MNEAQPTTIQEKFSRLPVEWQRALQPYLSSSEVYLHSALDDYLSILKYIGPDGTMTFKKAEVDLEVIECVENHDCGSGDYAAELHLPDGTVLDQCEVFGDRYESDISTLRYMGAPVPVEINLI